MRARMRAELDRQMEEKKQRKEQDKLEDLSHFSAQKVEWEQWGEMEKVRDEQRREKAARMKKEREEQVQSDRQTRDEQLRKKKEEEKDLMNKIAIELEKEKQKIEDAKMQKKMYMNKILLESEEERRVKALKAQEESKAEMDKTRAFNRSLDEKDEAKRKEAEAKAEEQKQNLLKMKAVLEKMEADTGEADQKLAFMQKAEADGRAQAIMQHREDRLREMRQENQAFLFQQMEEKRMQKQEDSDVSQFHAMLQGAENRAFLDMEKQRSVDRRERNVAHRLELQKQIEDKQKVHRDHMSEQELALNRMVLNCANDLHAKTMAEQ